ncbi:MAG: 8-amino-7-oxononanoate synthase [Candidatus Thiodiazotropha endolucinida]|uniref:8-amino-7-oxononanoate synthase n=2 Tax=Candidatus Thiodiazotropha TaxID=1913444 RepID=A0A7Z0VNP9_9GAMM|nr:8-amino-7-oxononanoate synthase [Candidatus Thiodiazotropha endolucinida]MBT3040704.1 8-amino-7-oxononanoate synthase [Candidatus Thiodiazotropha sp. (ex Codakia orbicularis)]MBV2126662.1 8-amino-7-oxononanoate synthase [Candidatus Thiodiazotropha taylori]MCG7980063.1 8-amino-7-oxononanoate synthase [Candidatus Thiodiazotropha taylori]MCW4238196.1 8-amino-7-oxononanoate synthase [Candidatus Thiodiazotropha endolucinida]ODJ89042.1 8-amino-7-oxononanoate synthase [Candidatus Thiodiazotropha e
MKGLAEALQKRRHDGLYRSRRVVSTAQQPELVVDGKRVIAFCSNDYLGLANHPEVVEAMQRAAGNYGVGSGAAHLITGHSNSHHRLEEALAEYTGRSRALLFSTGYMANIGVISALLKQGDRLFEDRLNHASLLDAGQLTRARMQRYRHADPESLRSQLKGSEQGQALIATDGVFSMDGDLAPLPSLVELARRHQAWLMVDDAHGLGVLGEEGGGVLSHFDLDSDDVPILMGTLGKGFGTYGAFVAGSEELIETLIQHARSYIYTTAPPAALAEATLVSLRLARQETWRRERLQDLIARFRQSVRQIGLPLLDSMTPIQPILAGSSQQAVAWSRLLEKQGVLVSAIRPPTVPDGSARLRITLSANHTDRQLDRLLDALSTLPLVVE